jgi:hypothetical protein
MNQPIETLRSRRQRWIAVRGEMIADELLAFAAASRQRLDEIEREHPEPPELIGAPIPPPAPTRPPQGTAAERELEPA